MQNRNPQISAWLSPLLGVAGFCIYSLHDHRSLWHSLDGALPFVIISIAPLLFLCDQSLKLTHYWAIKSKIKFLIWTILSGIFVSSAYYYAAYLFYKFFTYDHSEGLGDIVKVWEYDSSSIGIIAIIAIICFSH